METLFKTFEMKRYFILLITFALLLFSCKVREQKVLPKELQREWMMVEFRDFKKDELVGLKAGIQFSDSEKKEIVLSGFAGCNRVFATVKFSGKEDVEFTKTSSTEKFCANKMNVENEFLKALPNITKYKIDGHFLTFYNKTGEEIKFIASDWD